MPLLETIDATIAPLPRHRFNLSELRRPPDCAREASTAPR